MSKKRSAGRPRGNPARASTSLPGDEVEVTLSTYGDPLEELAGYVADRRELDALIAESISAARAAGQTWTALAGVLGVSPQAVQKRYGRQT